MVIVRSICGRIGKMAATVRDGFLRAFAEKPSVMSGEQAALAREVLEAMEAWKIAKTRFDEAKGEQVEWAVFALKAASTHYGTLITRAKERDARFDAAA